MGLLFIGAAIGAILSWIITHAYYVKSSQGLQDEISSLSNKIQDSNTLQYFSYLLDNSTWHKEFIEHKEVWIADKNNTFQIHTGNNREEFHETWTKPYPAQDTQKCSVYLKINTTIIKELLFIILDGGNIFVPIPDRKFDDVNNPQFFWNLNSLELKVCKIIGHYYIHQNIEGVAKMSKVNIIH